MPVLQSTLHTVGRQLDVERSMCLDNSVMVGESALTGRKEAEELTRCYWRDVREAYEKAVADWLVL